MSTGEPREIRFRGRAMRRVVPFVAEIRVRFPDLAVSVDTWRHEVGRLACEEGADLLNDWAGADPKFADVVAVVQGRKAPARAVRGLA